MFATMTSILACAAVLVSLHILKCANCEPRQTIIAIVADEPVKATILQGGKVIYADHEYEYVTLPRDTPEPQPGLNEQEPVVKTTETGLNEQEPVVKTTETGLNEQEPVVKTTETGLNEQEPVVKIPEPVLKTPESEINIPEPERVPNTPEQTPNEQDNITIVKQVNTGALPSPDRSMSLEEVEVKCVEEGAFGIPGNCTNFYHCVYDGNGGYTRHLFECGEGFVWDQKIRGCNRVENVGTLCGAV